MSKFKNGDLVEAFFFPDLWVDGTFIGRDGRGYVVRTVNGYKCSTDIRKRTKSSIKESPRCKICGHDTTEAEIKEYGCCFECSGVFDE